MVRDTGIDWLFGRIGLRTELLSVRWLFDGEPPAPTSFVGYFPEMKFGRILLPVTSFSTGRKVMYRCLIPAKLLLQECLYLQPKSDQNEFIYEATSDIQSSLIFTKDLLTENLIQSKSRFE